MDDPAIAAELSYRTTGQLKDKWRNLLQSGECMPVDRPALDRPAPQQTAHEAAAHAHLPDLSSAADDNGNAELLFSPCTPCVVEVEDTFEAGAYNGREARIIGFDAKDLRHKRSRDRPPSPNTGLFHTTGSRQTLLDVAGEYGFDAGKLLALNNDHHPDLELDSIIPSGVQHLCDDTMRYEYKTNEYI